MAPHGPIGAYLAGLFEEQAAPGPASSRVIWDMSAVAWVINAAWFDSCLAPSPRLTDDCRWCHDTSRHMIRSVQWLDRDAIFRDFFEVLQVAARS